MQEIKIYNILVEKYLNELNIFLAENYFFLEKHYDDIYEQIENELDINIKNDKNVLEIKMKILDIIKHDNPENINGYITFRYKNFIDLFNNISNILIEKFLLKYENEQFVNLLKHCIKYSETIINVVNINFESDNEFSICDENGFDVKDKFLPEEYESFSSDDVLISGLIVNCPQKIILRNVQNFQNKELLETLKNIFENKLCIM